MAAQAADLKAHAEALTRADALAKAQGEELVTERQAHRDGVAQLRAELSAAEKALATAGAKVDAAAETKASVQGDLVAARQRIESLEQAVAAERKAHKEEVAQIRAEMAAERSAHKDELSKLRTALEAAQKPLLAPHRLEELPSGKAKK